MFPFYNKNEFKLSGINIYKNSFGNPLAIDIKIMGSCLYISNVPGILLGGEGGVTAPLTPKNDFSHKFL